MAVSSVVKTRALAIEVQKGVDAAGDPTYNKKVFSGIKPTATADACYNTAEAIKAVLDIKTRNYFLNDVEVMTSQS